MCDYSLHAVATRPAKVGETIISTTFRGTSTRGFAAIDEPDVAVCLLPGTELGFQSNVRYEQRWIWPRSADFKVGQFRQIDETARNCHHDAIEFPDGSTVLVTHLVPGQQATVLQLPVQERAERDVEQTEPAPTDPAPAQVTTEQRIASLTDTN
uniref:Uncharacterized protein n=1 Tax=Rhodopseudomonas palustris (strain BisA53) TaxID=316055 RepID=Q07KH8_RHOP5